MVKQHYYDKLIHNIKTGLDLLIQYPKNHVHFAIDKWWTKLQKNDNWYFIYPPTVIQAPDYSDIEKRNVDYGKHLLDINKKWMKGVRNPTFFYVPTIFSSEDKEGVFYDARGSVDIYMQKKENNQNFWFISKNKEEPRLANRFIENGSELEQPLAIARDIKKLYQTLADAKNSLSIGKFLSNNNELRHVVRRAFIVEKFPFSEIQDNIIGKSLVPIDMLRLKLSFFGALKFDPRSDKWLRICMFQGAPLPHELVNFDDYWIYNSLN